MLLRIHVYKTPCLWWGQGHKGVIVDVIRGCLTERLCTKYEHCTLYKWFFFIMNKFSRHRISRFLPSYMYQLKLALSYMYIIHMIVCNQKSHLYSVSLSDLKKAPCSLWGHLVSQSKGHKVVNIDVIQRCLIEGIYLSNMNSEACLGEQLKARLHDDSL